METDEVVLEEFETDEVSADEVLALDAVDEASNDALAAAAGDELTSPPAADKVVAPQAAAADPLAEAESAGETDGLQGRDWVMSRSPAHYTIQLLGSWKRADAQAFVHANPLPGPGALIETKRRGKPWFSLYYGDFASYSEAAAAQSALKGGIARHGPWVRPYKKIQAGLK